MTRRGVLFAAAGFCGWVQAVAIAAPWDGQPRGWLQILSLAVLPVLLQRATSARQAAALGWTFATVWLAGSIWWLFVSMHRYGGLAAPLAIMAVGLLSAFLGSYYAAACFLYKKLSPASWMGRCIVFAALWLLAELMRADWFTGFPWGASGYAHVDSVLRGLAAWVGVYGMACVAAGLAAAFANVWMEPRRFAPACAAAAVLLLAAGLSPLPPVPVGEPLAVDLLQGNIAQDEKFEAGSGIPQALQWYGQQLSARTARLIITPETAVPLLPSQLPEGFLNALEQPFEQGQRAALVGMPLGSYEQGYTNSVVGFKPGDTGYRYDKHHLVPFGEFIPLGFRWFTQLMNIPLGDFNRGGGQQASFYWAGQRWAPNICYEDLFGNELAVRFADPATAPTVLVNMSNLAWFGNTVALDQHLHIGRMRALEFARPVLHATNTGATAVIDAQGQVVQQLPRAASGVLRATVQGATGLTPYARWASRFGNAPLWALVLAVLGFACLRRHRLANP